MEKGCLFYRGTLSTKMLALHTRRVPAFALPMLDGLLVATLSAIWLVSSLWFFTR